jgi:hypothetical protein
MMRNGYTNGMVRPFSAAMAVFIMTTVLAAAVAATPVAEGQKTFASPREAVSGLIAAIQADNNPDLFAIFGPGSEDLLSSGDPVADQRGRARFLQAYGARHDLVQESDSLATLHIGNKDYPFPVPIVREGGVWFFDTQAGMEEILNRRIGRNELHTIKVLHAYVEAQREFSGMRRDDGAGPDFAQKLTSSKGKKDGLYWEAGEGEEESPFGPLIAKAGRQGYAVPGLDVDAPEPYRGYYFRILKAQGEHASGGAFDYVVDGKMILGFGLVAYPAKYGSSGIMTFIINQEGMIYEKDLGEATTEVAAMVKFDPDHTWKRTEQVATE